MQPVLHRLAMVSRAQRFGGQHVAYVLVAVLDASPQTPTGDMQQTHFVSPPVRITVGAEA